ncbi:MAG: hypothetical protein AAB490_04185 [Patescibacteria group bacterium]
MRPTHWHRHQVLWTGIFLAVSAFSFAAGTWIAPMAPTHDPRREQASKPLLPLHKRLVVINIEGITLSETVSASDVDDVIRRCAAMYEELRVTLKRAELPRMELYTLRTVVRDGSYTVEIDRHELISSPSQRAPTARSPTPSS